MPAMKEGPSAYAKRMQSDYERIVGQPAPTIERQIGAENVTELQQRNRQIEDILAGGTPPEGAYIPTKKFKVDTSEAMSEIDGLLDETVQGDPAHLALTRIKRMLTAADGDPPRLNNVKISGIDNVIRKTNVPNLKRQMVRVKQALTKAMDEQLELYPKARKTWQELSPPVDRLKEGIVGALSELETPKELERATYKIFGQGEILSPSRMAELRQVVQAYDKDLWTRAIGMHVSNVYKGLVVTQEGDVVNAMGKMYKTLWGSKLHQDVTAAAFGPEMRDEFIGLRDLMKVFEHAAYGLGKESMTAPFQQIELSLRGVLGAGMMASRGLRAWTTDKIFTWWSNMILAGNQDRLLRSLTAPDAQAKLSRLKTMSPRSRKFIETLAVFTALMHDKIGAEKLPDTPQGQIRVPGQQPQESVSASE